MSALQKPKRNIRAAADAKLERNHNNLVKQFKEEYGVYNRSRTACMELVYQIHETEFWKKTHTSFGDFCLEVLCISKAHVYSLLNGAGVIKSLPLEDQKKITNPSQAGALSKVEPSRRSSVIREAEKRGEITAKSLGEAHSRISNNGTSHESGIPDSRGSVKSGVKSKNVFYDENNTPIPDDALKWWEKEWGEEHKDDVKVQEVLNEISRLKSIVVGGREKGELRWLKVTNSIENTFDSLRSLISEAKPYAVCTTCMGSPLLQPEGCNFCKNTGLISRWQWDTQSRQEVKDIVMRRAADLKKERENVH